MLGQVDFYLGPRPGYRGSVNTPVRAEAAATSGLYQIDLAVLRAAAALKVAVKGPQGNAACNRGIVPCRCRGRRRIPEFGRLRRSYRARAPFLGQHIQHLLGAGRDGQGLTSGTDGFAFQDASHPHHIQIGGVGAGADADLVHLPIGPISSVVLTLSGHVRAGRHRRQLAHRSMSSALVITARPRSDARGVSVQSSARPWAFRDARVISRRRGRVEAASAELRAHVGDGGAHPEPTGSLTPSPPYSMILPTPPFTGHSGAAPPGSHPWRRPRAPACRSD